MIITNNIKVKNKKLFIKHPSIHLVSKSLYPLNANNNICSLLNVLLVDYYPKSI